MPTHGTNATTERGSAIILAIVLMMITVGFAMALQAGLQRLFGCEPGRPCWIGTRQLEAVMAQYDSAARLPPNISTDTRSAQGGQAAAPTIGQARPTEAAWIDDAAPANGLALDAMVARVRRLMQLWNTTTFPLATPSAYASDDAPPQPREALAW